MVILYAVLLLPKGFSFFLLCHGWFISYGLVGLAFTTDVQMRTTAWPGHLHSTTVLKLAVETVKKNISGKATISMDLLVL